MFVYLHIKWRRARVDVIQGGIKYFLGAEVIRFCQTPGTKSNHLRYYPSNRLLF
jgi:hypothetical protein